MPDTPDNVLQFRTAEPAPEPEPDDDRLATVLEEMERQVVALGQGLQELVTELVTLRAHVALLRQALAEEPPWGTYVTWSRDGNTPDADLLQAWTDRRRAVLEATQ